MLALTKIKDLLEKENILVECKISDAEVIETTYDSREVKKGFLFYCKGKKFETKYLDDSIKNGAVVYVSEEKYSENCNYFIVNDIRSAMAIISNVFYEKSYLDLETIAITGTKGKTTVTHFIQNILDEFLKEKSAIISTIETYTGLRSEESHLTTPEAPLLHKLFKETKDSDIKYLTMEVTSQAYKTKRVDKVKFKHGMFLNISEDHISEAEHSDYNDYLNCKLMLLDNVEDMVLNRDMDCYDVVKEKCEKLGVKYTTYGKDKNADFYYFDEKKLDKGFSFIVKNDSLNVTEEFTICMQGRFNIENAVAAATICYKLGVNTESIRSGLSKTIVDGRMNVYEKDGVTIIVDYAHNALSFTKLYESIQLDYPNRNIISLGGGPGGKAYNRREDFGKIVGSGSNELILTAEDPQFERVEDICSDIIKFIPENVKYKVIPDRKEAIEYAYQNKKSGDVIILLAKGEEDYQKVEGVFTPYESDLKIIKNLLKI